jgi:hypothetical protein
VGHQHGLNIMNAHRPTSLSGTASALRGGAALWLSLTLVVSACGDDSKSERKRALLQPRDGKLKLEQEKEKRRIFDDDGDLLPSGEKVGGVMLPKGLTLYRRIDQHSFYRTTEIKFEKLDPYFAEQLISTTVERKDSAVTFGGAVPKNNLKAPRLELSVTRLRGGPSSSEVYIRQSTTFRRAPPPDSPEAQLDPARQFPD